MSWQRSVLVVANVTVGSEDLLRALRAQAEREPTLFTLLVPAAGGREAAAERLETALAQLREAGLEVRGQLGDPDPVVAVREAWSPLDFDEVVVSTLPPGASRWLLCDLPHRIERMTGVQVTHVEPEKRPRFVPGEPPPEQPHYGVLAPLAAAWSGQAPREAR